MDTFGKRLKEIREESNVTQIELANKLFLDKSTVAKYETDNIEPSLDILRKLCLFFCVSADFFLSIDDLSLRR